MAETTPNQGSQASLPDQKGGFSVDPATQTALNERVQAAQQAEAAESSSATGDSNASHNFGESWHLFRETCVHNDDDTYTAPDGTVYSEDGYVISEPEVIEQGEQEEDADERPLEEQWLDYLKTNNRERAIQDAISAHRAAHGNDSTWKYSDALSAALNSPEVLEKIYTKEQLEDGWHQDPDNERYIRGAVRAINTERRAARVARQAAREERKRIGDIEQQGGDEYLEFRRQEAAKIKDRLEEITAAVNAARDAIPQGKRGRLTIARRQALVDAGIYSEELAGMLPRGYYEQLFVDAAGLADGKDLEPVQSPPPRQQDPATRSGDRIGQNPPVDPEQEKKDKIAALVVKIGINKIDILKLVVEVKDPADMADDAKQSRVIRDTLKTLGIVTDADFTGLDDADILAILQSASPSVPVPPGGRGTTPGQQRAQPRIPNPPGIQYPGPAPGQQRTPPPPAGRTPGQQQVRIPNPPGAPYPGAAPGAAGAQSRNPNARFQAVEQTTHLSNMLTNVELAKLDQLDVARDKWAKISSKRQRRMLFGWAVKRSRKFKEAKEEYEQLSREVGRIGLQDKLAAASTSLQKNAIAAEYWIAEQNAVREKAAKYTTDRRWWKAANGVSQWLNKGPKTWRVVKRVGIGVVAGALTAASGGASVAPFIAGLTAFTTGQLKNLTGGIDTLTDAQKASLTSAQIPRIITDEEILASQAAKSEALYSKDSRIQQNKRLLKMGKNAAIGAATGVAFYYGHEAVRAGYEHLFGSDSASAAGAGPSGTEGTTPDAGGAGGGHDITPPTGPDTPGYGLGDAGPQDVLPSAPSGHELLNSTDAFYVKPGEGWYETFQDMGIPKEHWAEVLKDAGPKLEDLGVADFHTADGQWWISQSGNLKPEVLQTIADSSAKFGYAFKPIA